MIAQAAATAAAMMPGRFFLGVGTGENLNEHVVGEGWPSPDVRREMLEDAVAVIHVYVHQIGPDQEGFFRFYEKRVLPEVA